MQPDLILTITHAAGRSPGLLEHRSIRARASAGDRADPGAFRNWAVGYHCRCTPSSPGTLGVDLSTPELLAAERSRYEAAIEAFTQAAAEKRDLTSLFSSIKKDNAIVIANPPDWRDLAWYRDLGLNIIDPDAEALEYWESSVSRMR